MSSVPQDTAALLEGELRDIAAFVVRFSTFSGRLRIDSMRNAATSLTRIADALEAAERNVPAGRAALEDR